MPTLWTITAITATVLLTGLAALVAIWLANPNARPTPPARTVTPPSALPKRLVSAPYPPPTAARPRPTRTTTRRSSDTHSPGITTYDTSGGYSGGCDTSSSSSSGGDCGGGSI